MAEGSQFSENLATVASATGGGSFKKKKGDLVAIDFETSGLVPGLHGPRSIGAVCDGVRPFLVFIEHDDAWVADPVADCVNGYSEALWRERGAVRLDVAMVWFCRWWAEARSVHGRLQPLAHNAAFDRAWLEWCLKATVGMGGLGMDHRWRCSMCGLGLLMDAGLAPAGSASLDRLCELAGMTGRARAHDALWDAGACLEGYRWMISTMRNFKKEGGAV